MKKRRPTIKRITTALDQIKRDVQRIEKLIEEDPELVRDEIDAKGIDEARSILDCEAYEIGFRKAHQ